MLLQSMIAFLSVEAMPMKLAAVSESNKYPSFYRLEKRAKQAELSQGHASILSWDENMGIQLLVFLMLIQLVLQQDEEVLFHLCRWKEFLLLHLYCTYLSSDYGF